MPTSSLQVEPCATARKVPSLHTGRWYVDPAEYMADRLGYLERLHQAHGDVAHFKMGLWNIYVVNHPDYVKQMFVADAHKTRKSAVIRLGRIILGNGLLSSEGELHKKQRRLIAPAFHRKRIAHYVDAMSRQARELSAQWHDGQQLDMHEEMMRLTLSVIGETMFGADVSEQSKAVNECLESIFVMLNRITSPFNALKCLLPLPSNAKFLYARWKLDRIVYAMIEERSRNPQQHHDDLLQMLLDARDEEGDGSGMDRRQIRDEVLILFLAGHETTANALTWTWYLLSQHPEVEQRLHVEIDRVLEDQSPTFEDVMRLPYTRMVIEESMRCFPPVYAIDRDVMEPITLGPYHIPRGSTIFVSPWCLHHDPRYFPDPERFDPDRWLPEEKERRPKHCYFPFGMGTRSCIGEQFAWAEAIVLLAALARNWRAELMPGTVVEPYPLITVRPKNGLPVILRKRTHPSG